MTVEITIEVEYYRPVHVDSSSTTLLLQSPVSPERQLDNGILVRQDQGQFKNAVSFKPAAQVHKVSRGYHRTYAHGVLIQSSPDRRYRKGDRVWLTETAHEDRNVSVQNQTSIIAVNLRTWTPMTIALSHVCWVPKFRKIERGEDEEELLTISGPPVRKQDRKLYLLAIVQRLRLSNDSTAVERVELREIIEQDSFKYQNLTALPDGKRTISELFHRSLAAVAPAFFQMGPQSSTTHLSNTPMPQVGRAPDQSMSLVTPPPEEHLTQEGSPDFSISLPHIEDEVDPDVKRKIEELQRVVEAKKARKCKPLLPAAPPPADMCNLGERCPTPHRVFFHANRPSLENPFPRHHHRPDHECQIGAAHAVHCVFRFLEGRNVPDKRLCIIPATVRHHCCETNARPVNKTFRRRPEMIDGGHGSVQVTGGRGTVSVVSGQDLETEQHCGVPFEVRPMPLVPERDLDELGWQLYNKVRGLADGAVRSSPVDHAGDCDESDDEATDQCQLHAVPGLSREHEQIHQGRPCLLANPSPGAPPSAQTSPPPGIGSAASRPIVLDGEDEGGEEPDAFGERHFYGDDGFDEEMELDEH
ncbi:hypothetical protein KVR01_002710 [Diaporthe batatas]|uniref:uncharacterized protein n=1 Tax=Diaporthe batatas TaxID=748121 RepID=UPI001D044C79|nr:uncharacterized protein KVR01_002710 [Diaporthe batatas]KAG8167021.1 hypothetical protein KVR01_002710 [Diaporthe batatas]